jgi:CitMHS family citrate-Mg2+:H+ or citrate-Ca2+:H+ symporter
MISILAFTMVVVFMALIMTERLSALVALIIVPTAFALLLTQLLGGLDQGLGAMMLAGVSALAPTGVMLVFAILFFGLMIDVGVFDPVVRTIVRAVDADPVRILVGSALLALIVSLDGDGATTYMITTAAMLPLYRHLKMDVRMLACVVIMASGVMNVLPWGGPSARVISVLKLDAAAIFVPLIPAMLASALWTIFVAYRFGLKERTRLALLPSSGNDRPEDAEDVIASDPEEHIEARRPRLFPFNAALTIGLIAALVLGLLPTPILFMLAFAIALTVNFPRVVGQRERLAAHAPNALAVGGLVFAAGIFTGILSGTKMVDAMAATVVAAIPASLGVYLAPITALISAPFTFFISNDAFYYGMLPILVQTGSTYGLSPAEIGRAALVGQQVHLLSPLVASTYLLVGFVGVEFGEHQRFTLKWALGSCLVFAVTAVLSGAFPVIGRG